MFFMSQSDRASLAGLGEATASPGTRERALVEQARNGNHDAFAEIVESRLGPTFRTAMAILGSEADARDATQTIFVRAWSGLPGLVEADRFPAWFGRIVVNTCRTAVRDRRRRIVREIPMGGLADGGESLSSGSGDQEGETAAADRLERAIERLSGDERAILVLHHMDGLSLAEVGERLGVPSKTVKSRLFTARRALQRSLGTEDR